MGQHIVFFYNGIVMQVLGVTLTDYLAVPFWDDAQNPNSMMEMGYVVRKNALLSLMRS